MRHIITFIFALLMPISAMCQASAIDSLALYHAATAMNSGQIQQEIIYLHLDNNSYYRGDRIFFACYLVTSGRLRPSSLSRTVYVELLNPNGKIIDRCVLNAVNGRCSGSLLADETPFYSGYYEIRAYTSYMLNFGPEAFFSRVIPIFAAPKKEGNWADRRMLKYGSAKHQFSRPTPIKSKPSKQQTDRFDISVDNATDSVAITVSSPDKAMIGATLMCRGELCGRAILDFNETRSTTFKVARRRIPSGVVQLTLFDVKGTPIAERLFFNNRRDFIAMEYSFDKEHYKPFEPVELTVKLSKPVPFSLSVNDAAEYVAYGSDIRSELLLGTDMNGFVSDLGTHLDNPDSLLTSIGHSRYTWNTLAGLEPMEINHMPEQGIEVHGFVQGQLRNKRKSGVTVSMMLSSVGNDSTGSYIDEFVTDSLGRFAFRGDLHGDWMMTLLATDKGKQTRNRILLEQSERPAPRAYNVAEMQYDMADIPIIMTDSVESDDELIKSLELSGVKQLREVEVTAYGGHTSDLRHYIENSVTSYDVASARSLLQDKGKKFIRKLGDIMPFIDPKFSFVDGRKLIYGTKMPIFFIDKDMADNRRITGYYDIDSSNPADLPVDMVKTVYVNTQREAIDEYAIKFLEEGLDVLDSIFPEEIKNKLNNISPTSGHDMGNRDFRSSTYRTAINMMFGCVVFVELTTSNASMIRPGMRRTVVEGYTDSEEFQHPDYQAEPPIEPDYRRTLYWNPEVIPDENGIARIKFFNNGSAQHFVVTAAALSPDGKIGALR